MISHNLVEFQAVVLACEEGSDVFPLAVDHPKPLLPVVNKPLLSYQLSLLEQAHFSHVMVVTLKEYAMSVGKYISEEFSGLSVDLQIVEEVEGTLDALRQVKDKIFTDFILISGDLVTEASIHDLADVHRLRDATVTMLLKESAGMGKDDIKKTRKASNGIVSYFGTIRDKKNKRSRHSRVAFMKTAAQDTPIEIKKSLLKREPEICIRTDLEDAHMYIFRRWVLELLDTKRKMASIQDDFIPYLVNLQYRDPESCISDAMVEKAKPKLSLSHAMSAVRDHAPTSKDLVRCYAFVVPVSASFCRRASSLNNYSSINHDIAVLPVAPSTPWDKPQSHVTDKYKGSIVGRDCVIGENVILKNCVVGNHCKLGAKVKLNHCILMDYVTVGNDTTIQNSILCNNSVVQERCNINDCQIAARASVAGGSRLRNDSILPKESEAFMAYE